MSSWKDIKIIKQEQKQRMVDKDSLWILEKAMTTSRMGSQNASIVTSTDIWPKSVGRRKKKI